MCHRKWSGTLGQKPKPKVNSVWADTAIEPANPAQRPLPNYPVHLISFALPPTLWAMQCVINARAHSTRSRPSIFRGPLPNVVRLMTPRVWHTLTSTTQRVTYTYFWQPLNLPTAARWNRKCTECGTTAFGRNRMSAKSARLSTFGAETKTEIRSTSSSTCHKSRRVMAERMKYKPESLGEPRAPRLLPGVLGPHDAVHRPLRLLWDRHVVCTTHNSAIHPSRLDAQVATHQTLSNSSNLICIISQSLSYCSTKDLLGQPKSQYDINILLPTVVIWVQL